MGYALFETYDFSSKPIGREFEDDVGKTATPKPGGAELDVDGIACKNKPFVVTYLRHSTHAIITELPIVSCLQYTYKNCLLFCLPKLRAGVTIGRLWQNNIMVVKQSSKAL